MFDLYKIEHKNSVCFSSYKRIFYDNFNLRFKKPTKDTCLRCDTFKTKLQNPTLSLSERQMIQKCHNDHIDHATALENQMKKDLELAQTDVEVETLTFDMQKTHSLPKLTANIVYYMRQLNLYNLGIHVGSTLKGMFNIWLEYEASKGTQEVGSCLKKYIFENIKAPVKKLFLWSDSCGGQNRSIKLVLFLIHILQNHTSLESISIRYRQSGHTFNQTALLLIVIRTSNPIGHSFLPNDTEFSDVECALKQHEKLCTDIKIMEIMRNCRLKNKFVVNRMSKDDFFSVKELEKSVTNRKKDVDKTKVNWLNIHEIFIEKSQPTILKMRRQIRDVFSARKH